MTKNPLHGERPDESFGATPERAAHYDRLRPPYPAAALEHVIAEMGIVPGKSVLADIGAGNGLLSQAFAARGFNITLVEPNPNLRAQAARKLGDKARIVEGMASATTLPDGAVDLVVAGSAAHWFVTDPELRGISPEKVAATRAEWRRISRNPTPQAALFNMRPTGDDMVIAALLAELERSVEAWQKRYAYMFYEPGLADAEPRALLENGGTHYKLELPVSVTLQDIIDYMAISNTLGSTFRQDPEIPRALSRLLAPWWGEAPDSRREVLWRCDVHYGAI